MDFLPDSVHQLCMVYWEIPVWLPAVVSLMFYLFRTWKQNEKYPPTDPSPLFVRQVHLPSSSTMHGFESQHCHLVVKATKPHLIHRDGSPTHHHFTTVCSRVCLASPRLNTKHKASHALTTIPLIGCLLTAPLFFVNSPLFCVVLCLITASLLSVYLHSFEPVPTHV